MAKINFNLRSTETGKKTPLVMFIRWDKLRLKYSTGETIDPTYWNNDDQKAKEIKRFPEYPEFNIKLQNLKTLASNTFRTFKNDNNRPPTPEELRSCLDIATNRTEVQVKHNLISFIAKFKEEARFKVNARTGKTYAAKTLTSYKQVSDLLTEYNSKLKRPVDFKDIDFEFYTDFVRFMTENKEYSVNSIGKHIKTLKTILNEATERGVNENVKFRSKKFKVLKQSTDSIYLTIGELEQIEKLDLNQNPKLDKVRDLFLIGSYTGLRFSDFTNIQHNNIKGNTIEILTQKTGQPVAIPIHETVKKILAKYKGIYSTPLPAPLSNQKMNDYLKELCSKIDSLKLFVPIRENKAGITYSKNYQKFDLVTTHTARRSFATNNFKDGISSRVIMAITGHKTETAFLSYIKITPTENAEIMRLHWDKATLKIS